ncbi:MAG: DUF1194 domain-containing protein [Rhodospirillales bacterium]
MTIRSIIAGLLGALALLALAFAAPAVQAQKIQVDLELVIAVDVSGSIDPVEAQMQRQGYYAAFTNAKVINAIKTGPNGRIGMAYMEWAGSHYQRTVIEWTLIDGAEAARQFVARLADVPPTTQRWTSISGAIDYGVRLLRESPFDGARKVIDVSGDGTNNNGRSVIAARDEAVAQGIVINGLPIVNERPTAWGGMPERNLDTYYESHVIGGPGSFMVVADGFEKFGDAILSKLIQEIAGAPPEDPSGGPARYAAVPAPEAK